MERMVGKMKLNVITLICLLLTTTQNFAQKRVPAPSSLPLTKPTDEPMATLVNINNISMWIRADGWSGRNPLSGSSGILFPRGTVAVIFQDGILWGGLVRDGQSPEVRVGGQTFLIGTVPGRILSKGIAEDPNAPDVRIWRIRRDYQTADLTRDAAEINNIPIEEVTEEQIHAVRDQYEKDWNEWPVGKGAPFNDSNGNGIRDPGEEPGIAGADQVVWFAANDLDSTATLALYGSPPIGLEMQVTLWGYNRPDILGNVIFKRVRLIYKGTEATPDTAHIDSMFIAQWADPDLGAYSDDFAGCDSTLQIGFAYNSSSFDALFAQFNLIPPAVGYALLQGPIVASENPQSTARFDFGVRNGYVNLRLFFFWHKGSGSAISDPVLGSFESGTLPMYNLLRGFLPWSDPDNPQPFHDGQGNPTRFPICGDPVTGTGDIDGIHLPPGDRRFLLSSGPFSLALGDTQEVIIGLIGASGGDHILSVAELQKATGQIQTLAKSLFRATFPTVSVAPDYSDKQQTQFSIQAQAQGASTVLATFTNPAGTTLATFPLFDDGAHQDSLAGDGLFGNVWTSAPLAEGLSLGLVTISPENDTLAWPRLLQQISTFGPVEAVNLLLSSDNINSDGQTNPGENILLSARVGNAGIQSVESLKILISTEDPWVEVQDPAQSLEVLPDQDTVTVAFDLENPETFSRFQIAPDAPPGHLIEFEITLYDKNFNLWQHKKTLMVQPFPLEPETQLVQHLQGPARGTFGLYILEPSALTGDAYRITINDTSGQLQDRTLNLIDITIGDTLLKSHPLPDEFSHNMPITDGFKLTRGTLVFKSGLDQLLELAFAGQPVDPAVPIWHQPNSNGSYALSAGGGDGSLDRITRGRNLENLRDRDLELRFTENGGHGWWAFDNSGTGIVPFELWDIGTATPEDTTDDVRLIPLHFSGGGTPAVFDINPSTLDGFFGLPATDWIYFYTGDYQAFEQDAMDGTINDESVIVDELLARLVFVDLDQDGQIPPPGTTVRITTLKPPTNRDVYEFVPVYTGVEENPNSQIPDSFELFQNYPNPFNPATTIRYHLPVRSQVTLTIYNVLGQEVVRLVDKVQPTGKYTVPWDGKSKAGQQVSSGLYFYKIKTERFTQVKKMLLVR